MHLLAIKTRRFTFSLASGLLRRRCVRLIACSFVALNVAIAHGQLLERATVITNARIITGSGKVIEKGSIVIKGGRIEAVGAAAKAPFLSKKIAGAGKTVTPGLIDVWSALGRTGTAGDGDATSRAQDGFDRYARDDFREALRNGITTVYIGADGGAGVNGTGAVFQLAPGPGRSAGKVQKKDAALCVNFGSDQSPLSRLKTFAAIRKQFQSAVDYRTSLEDYEEDLKEYLEKLEERVKKEEGDKKDSKDAAKDEAPSDDEKPAPKPADEDDSDEEEKDDGDDDHHSLDYFFAGADNKTPPAGNGKGDAKNGKNGKDGDKKKDEDELKKPKKPAFSAVSEVVLKAIDHELPVRIEAHRSADILNALALADEFNLDIVIEGATEAYLVADALADAEVSVILGQVGRSAVFEDTEFRRHTARNAERLTDAGVKWMISSGGRDPRASRFVGFNSQMAMPSAGTKSGLQWSWLTRLTGDASRFLSLSQQVGRVARGMEADLVIWSGDPGDPASIVERVFVGGKLAYIAPQLAGGGS
jgi:imidazolonepropionase-like amidohydrolase